MIKVRTGMYVEELDASGRYMENTDDSVNALTQTVLNILIKSNPMIIIHRYLEELARDYCQKNISCRIAADIRTHICENNEFNLDGYVFFRTRAYSARIDDFLTYVLKRIAVKDKHDRLIDELRNYVAHNKPSKEIIYLDNTKGYYEIFDETYSRLTREAVIVYAREYGIDKGLMSTDIVMNYLLTTLPKRILLRVKNETPNTFIQTLNLVFGDRVSKIN